MNAYRVTYRVEGAVYTNFVVGRDLVTLLTEMAKNGVVDFLSTELLGDAGISSEIIANIKAGRFWKQGAKFK